MKVKERRYTTTKTVYVANDGRSFKYESDCRVYEKYAPATIYDVLKDYCIFQSQEMIEELKKNIVPYNCYLVLKPGGIPRDISHYCNIIDNNEEEWVLPLEPFYPNESAIYYHEDSIYDIKWKRIGTKKSLLKDMERLNLCLDLIEKSEK